MMRYLIPIFLALQLNVIDPISIEQLMFDKTRMTGRDYWFVKGWIGLVEAPEQPVTSFGNRPFLGEPAYPPVAGKPVQTTKVKARKKK